MNHATHALGGAAGWLGCCLAAHPAPGVAAGGALAAAIAAPFNDIDNLGAWAKRSKRQVGLKRDRRGRYHFRFRPVRWHAHPVKYRVSWLIHLLGDHREGPCHGLPPIAGATLGLLCAAAVTGFPAWVGLAVGLGLATHVGLDLLNERPVRAMWPLPWMGAAGVMAVGKAGEHVFRWVLTGLVLWLAWLTVRGYR